MQYVPIVGHFVADPPPVLRTAVDRLAEALRRERPQLAPADQFRALLPERLEEAPSFHLDDLSEISRLDPGEDVQFYQDRARLRAGDGDLVASCGHLVAGEEEYYRDRLGLGSPVWLRPRSARNRLRIAEACWEDAEIRQTLIDKLRRGEFLYVHPHMGTFSVWEIAALLHEETRCPLKVIAPPPGLTGWVNDKVAFTEAVSRLFGPSFVPRTESAWNLVSAAQCVKHLAEQSQAIGLKLPDAGGGAGNIVLQADQFRGRSLSAICETLRGVLPALDWQGEHELLIDSWELDVVSSPSAQLWIPPEPEGPPVVEGIFDQTTEGREGMFVGTAPAHFPPTLYQEITDRCWLLGRLFQRLGYVGRCSFDMILVGQSVDDCRIEFIECNGRWGGTSLPMTLMNRIFGDWAAQPYAVQICHHIEGLSESLSFQELLQNFQQDLFDVHTRRGSLILYNPGQMRSQSGIPVILLAPSWEESIRAVREIPERLCQLVQKRTELKSQQRTR